MNEPEDRSRPAAGEVEERTAGVEAVGRRIRGLIPYGVESRDLGGWREVISPTAFRTTDLSELRAVIDHKGVPLARYPNTLDVEDSGEGLRWSVDPPKSRQDVIEAVERGDMRAGSWRMVVGRDRWDGDVRHVDRIDRLIDVTLCGAEDPAYGDAAVVEYRSGKGAHSLGDSDSHLAPAAGDTVNNAAEERQKGAVMSDHDEQRSSEERTEETVEERVKAPQEAAEERTEARGSLQVEDRQVRSDEPVEARVMSELSDAMRQVSPGESRALTDAISLTPTAIATTLFDRLRAAAVMLRSGITVLNMPDADSVTYPSITADVSPATYSEAGAITPGDPTFSSVTATPRKIAHLIQMSNEVLDDSTPPLEGVLRDHLLATLALKLDQQLLEGSGTPPDIRGLKNVAGISTVTAGTNGATPTFDMFADCLATLEANNVPLDRVAIACHPRNVATLRKLKASTAGTYLWSSAEPAGPSPRAIFGVPLFTTPQLSTTEVQGTSGSVANSAYVFDTANVIYVRRQDPQIVLDRSRLFNSDQSELRATMRGDLIVPNPTGVVRLTGLLP
jgi:HK97 family phage major capsid protein